MNNHKSNIIVVEIKRPDPDDIRLLANIDTSYISDWQGKSGHLPPEIKPLLNGMRLCGPVVTCLGADRDVRRMAINLCRPGDVLLVAAGGKIDRACFGGTTAKQMQLKGIQGIVIDGATRDSAEIRELGFPTFCRGISPTSHQYPVVCHSGINIPVQCGEQTVHPGDILVADDDGVVVIPLEEFERSIKHIVQTKREKALNRATITKFDGFDVSQSLQERGFVQIQRAELI